MGRRHVHPADHAPACREHGEGRDGHAGTRHCGTGRSEHSTRRDEPGVDLDLPVGLVVMVHDPTIHRRGPTLHPGQKL